MRGRVSGFCGHSKSGSVPAVTPEEALKRARGIDARAEELKALAYGQSNLKRRKALLKVVKQKRLVVQALFEYATG